VPVKCYKYITFLKQSLEFSISSIYAFDPCAKLYIKPTKKTHDIVHVYNNGNRDKKDIVLTFNKGSRGIYYISMIADILKHKFIGNKIRLDIYNTYL
jgi:hypothetical protein